MDPRKLICCALSYPVNRQRFENITFQPASVQHLDTANYTQDKVPKHEGDKIKNLIVYLFLLAILEIRNHDPPILTCLAPSNHHPSMLQR